MGQLARRWVAAAGAALAMAAVPFSVSTIAAPAPSRAEDCPDGQVSVNDPSGWGCENGPCPPGTYDIDGVCIPLESAPPPPPPPPPPVYVPGWRPNVNACVNVGRRISVSGCI
ncbi:RNA-binding protein [Mycobacterium sp.]|uniref:RNA-binding protein n=1 Tax=Mycobacterium sp. TaxID=1785 RepID=UPI002B9AB40C|nr:RNA-binding protein [Mycobacterium sp.]HKP44702.1 RNA-binding protein [Mycobacterium sp.]